MKRIQNKKKLMVTLYLESYGKLAFWADGSWTDVGSEYKGEQKNQDRNDPVYLLSRRRFCDIRHNHFFGETLYWIIRVNRRLIFEIEKEINDPTPSAGSSPVDRAIKWLQKEETKKALLTTLQSIQENIENSEEVITFSYNVSSAFGKTLQEGGYPLIKPIPISTYHLEVTLKQKNN